MRTIATKEDPTLHSIHTQGIACDLGAFVAL